jgi:hypothetical protein
MYIYIHVAHISGRLNATTIDKVIEYLYTLSEYNKHVIQMTKNDICIFIHIYSSYIRMS